MSLFDLPEELLLEIVCCPELEIPDLLSLRCTSLLLMRISGVRLCNIAKREWCSCLTEWKQMQIQNPCRKTILIPDLYQKVIYVQWLGRLFAEQLKAELEVMSFLLDRSQQHLDYIISMPRDARYC